MEDLRAAVMGYNEGRWYHRFQSDIGPSLRALYERRMYSPVELYRCTSIGVQYSVYSNAVTRAVRVYRNNPRSPVQRYDTLTACRCLSTTFSAAAAVHHRGTDAVRR